MDERVVQFRVGVVILATVLIGAILILLFTDTRTLFQGSKTVYVTLSRAPGIAPDTPVHKNGVLVGRVKSVELKGREVLVTLSLAKDKEIYGDDTCHVAATLLGDASLELVPAEGAVGTELIQEGATISGSVAKGPFELLVGMEEDLKSAFETFGKAGTSIDQAGQQVNQLAGQLNDLLSDNDQQIQRILDRTEEAMAGFKTTTDAFDRILGSPEMQENLRNGLNDLPKLVADTRRTMNGLEEAVAVAEVNMRNLQGFTEPLGERGEALIEDVEASLAAVDEILQEFTQFSRALNSSEGTLGQLLHNPELYNNLNDTVVNVNQLSRQLRPILYDVRVFTDKVARDPGRIGVSGALRKRTGIK